MRIMSVVLAAVLLAGCEKVIMEEETQGLSETDGNVVLMVATEPQHTGRDVVTRAVQELSAVCQRLNVAVFDADGKKVKTVSQAASDADFGVVGLSVAPGTYKVVAVAHNCTGNATITSTEKVTFPNNKVTDTFCWYGTLTATADRQEVAVILPRCVAMLRVVLTGSSLRDDIASVKFYYLGGSSTFSPSAGFGCVNSKQTEVRAWNDAGVFELYTMPHSAEDVLTKVEVTAYDAGDNVVAEGLLENVPVALNRVTQYTGDLFGSGGGTVGMTLTIDPTWDGDMIVHGGGTQL